MAFRTAKHMRIIQVFACMKPSVLSMSKRTNHANPVAAPVAGDSPPSICKIVCRRRLAAAGWPPAGIRAGGAQQGELEILYSLTDAHRLRTGRPYCTPDAELAMAVVSPAPEHAACHGASMIASSGNRGHCNCPISSWMMCVCGGVGGRDEFQYKYHIIP